MTSNPSRSPRTRGGRAASRESTGTNGTSTGSVATSRYATPEPEPLPEPRLGVDQAESSNGPPSVGLLQHIYTAPDFIISYEGSSQYEAGGVSACGLAALNCVRVILGKEQSGIRAEALLRDMTSRETFQEIMSICAGWSGSAHLEVEEIARIPLFQRCFSSAGTFFERPGIGAFKSMLQHLQASVPDTESAAVVITRPPEIVACMKIATPFGGVFVIFDSHPRPSHPNGAAFVFNTSLDTTAKHLSELMAVDRRLLSDRDMQWQTQLLANFSGLFLKAKQIDESLPTLHYTIYDLSLQLLDLQGQTAELKSSNNQLKESMITMRDDNSLLVAENAQLQEEMIALRRELAEEKRRNERNGNGTWFSSVWSGSSSSQGHSSSSKGKSKEKDKEPYERWTMGRPHHQYDLRDRGISTWSSTRGSRSPPRRRSPPRTPPRARSPLQPSVSPSSSRKDATSPPGFHPPVDVFPRKKSTEQLPPLRERTPPVPPEDEDLMLAQRLHMQFNSAAMADANLAARLQREFEAEDSRIFQEQRELQQYVRPTFECQVCFEETPEDDIARISECDHLYCRDCLRGHIMNRVGEHRYPILCPSCTASPTKTPSVITDDMVRVIGIPEREYGILEEMSLASFSIMLHCRQCQNSSFVARDEYDEVKVLECPLPACHYMWCKQCQQPATSETEHSCDGSKELENLMSQRGWKYCPGCKTPIQKETGCNHMTCTSPGCNMHFCYRCGGDIIASAVSSEVRSAISSHYARCSLFEELPDRAVPP